MRRDYYAVLSVAATAPPREIRQADRGLELPFAGSMGNAGLCERPASVWPGRGAPGSGGRTPGGGAVSVWPPATQAGQVFRLRGQAVPRPGDDVPGDLFVTVRVDVPGGLDARTDELVRELERHMPLTARGDLERFRAGTA